MKRILFILVVAAITVLIILGLKRPDVLTDIWLWLIGLAGMIAAFIQKSTKSVEALWSQLFPSKKVSTNLTPTAKNGSTNPTRTRSDVQSFEGITLRLLRYSDDGDTSLGLLYIDEHFYGYTLEDTFNVNTIAGRARIPEGIYMIDFHQEASPFTKQYQKTRSWFSWHLQLKNVEGFKNVYIHNGGTHEDSKGSILISKGLDISDSRTFLQGSKETFEEFYGIISDYLNADTPVRIEVLNEYWIEEIKTKN